MNVDQLSKFQKSVTENSYPCYLILSKDKGEQQKGQSLVAALQPEPPVVFSGEGFSPIDFANECETMPFISKKKVIAIHELEKLKKEHIKGLIEYLQQPAEWVSLSLSGAYTTSMSKLVSAVGKIGIVLRIADLKPWEKDRVVSEQLVETARELGVALSAPVAKQLVLALGTDYTLLRNELKKLACYISPRKEIEMEDVRAISQVLTHETLWQLGEALFQCQTQKAMQIGGELLQDEVVLIQVLAHLRSQMERGLEIFSLMQIGGKPAVMKAFPYLKGKFLDKQLALLQHYREERLKRGLVILFDYELKARNSPPDPELVLETLLSRLTHDTLSLT